MKTDFLKRNAIAIIIMFIAYETYSQVPIDRIKAIIKCNFPCLQPLPADKTFNIEYPTLQYSSARNAMFESSGYFKLPNKWETEKPADYTFKFDLPGIKFTSIEPLEMRSAKTVTEKEFFRIYTFTCPAKLTVIDNSTHQIIKTIVVTTEEEIFTKTYHKNFFAKSGQAGDGIELGFETLQQLYERKDKDAAILSKIENECAAKTFTKMKEMLMHLYGEKRFVMRIPVLNPGEKKRKYDFSDFDSIALTFKNALDSIDAHPSNSSYPVLLDNAEKFYTQIIQDHSQRFEDHVPAITFWNLAIISLFKNQLPQADEYMNKLKTAKKPAFGIYGVDYEEFKAAKDFFALRNKIK